MHLKTLRLALITIAGICAVTVLAFGQSQQPSQTAEPSPSSPAESTVVRVSSGVTQGLLIKRVNPEYPKKARKNHIQGTVVLHARISKAGDIVELSTISGDPVLAESAIKAVRQWKYKPYLLQGNPVEVDTEIRVNFTLSSS